MNRDNIYECNQGDEQWRAVRCGMVTSSRIADAISFLTRKSKNGEKGNESQARIDLKYELACEIMTEQSSGHYVSRWMKEGKEKEPLARAAYERLTGNPTEQIGFYFHPKIKMAGCSPDSLIGTDGAAEYKCPLQHTHLGYLIRGIVPAEYLPQCHWIMACCELDWIDFVSHAPEFKRKEHKNFIKRLYRDDAVIRDMEENVMRFNDEVQEMVLKLDPDYLVKKLADSVAQVRQQKESRIEQELYV